MNLELFWYLFFQGVTTPVPVCIHTLDNQPAFSVVSSLQPALAIVSTNQPALTIISQKGQC